MSDTHDDDFIKITESEDSDFIEFPMEEDGTVLLSTIQTQFPEAIGIKYRGSSGAWRAIKEVDNVLAAPKGGWGDNVYVVTVSESKKRKSSTSTFSSNIVKKSKPAGELLHKDLAVIGLPFKLKTEELQEYFEKNFGETAYCDIKFDRETGKSRGFGFVRFKDEDNAHEAVEADHYLLGRKFIVKLKREKPIKLFVGRLPNGTTQEDLDKYFSQFGELKDTYIPQPFRNFGFLTYASFEDGRACLKESHELNGTRLNVVERKETQGEPGKFNRDDRRGDNNRRGHDGGRGNDGGGRGQSSGRNDIQTFDTRFSTPLPQPMVQQNNMADGLKNMLFHFLANQ